MNPFNKNGQPGVETTLKGPEKRAQEHKIGIPKKEPDNPDKDTLITENVSLKSFKYPLPVEWFMEKTIEEKIEKDVLNVFENSTGQNYWKSLNEISKRTGYSPEQIYEAIDDSWTFAQNRKKEFTTRKLYRKFTPFVIKCHHCLINQIN